MAGSSSATWQLGVSKMKRHDLFQASKLTPLGHQPLQSCCPDHSFSSAHCSWPTGPLDASHFPALTPNPHLLLPQATWVQPLWEPRPGGSYMRMTGLMSATTSW